VPVSGERLVTLYRPLAGAPVPVKGPGAKTSRFWADSGSTSYSRSRNAM
jgi:hypothetical protein